MQRVLSFWQIIFNQTTYFLILALRNVFVVVRKHLPVLQWWNQSGQQCMDALRFYAIVSKITIWLEKTYFVCVCVCPKQSSTEERVLLQKRDFSKNQTQYEYTVWFCGFVFCKLGIILNHCFRMISNSHVAVVKKPFPTQRMCVMMRGRH